MTDKNAINIYRNKALVNLKERFPWTDWRGFTYFKALNGGGISVGVISQQAIENGISVLVDEDDAQDAVDVLKKNLKKKKPKVTSAIFIVLKILV
jgi:aspartokinase/homoserine dehydrogenase 1